MKRRKFIKSSSLLAVPTFVKGIPISAMATSSLEGHMNADDRVLVLIELNGGNDGLASVIPIDQQDNLAQVRANILIPENQTLYVTDTIRFAPSMQGLKEVFDQGRMNIVQNVAYPNQNRSHFRSVDIWNTASAADEYLATGWIGRYLDTLYPNYPDGYPSPDHPDPFALTIGTIVSETCQGTTGNFSLAVINPEDVTNLAIPPNSDLPAGCFADKVDFITTTIEQSNVYGDTIEGRYASGSNLSSKYPDGNNLAEKLKIVARLIAGGSQTKIYVVNLGGFDTHASQGVDGDPLSGRHPDLMQELSDAVCAFQDDLVQLGLDERVVGMTYSEFGRRIRSNFSLGTDHGTAAPMMIFGSCVNPAILGDNPVISPDAATNEGVPMQFDFRSVYGSILMDWFEVEEAVVKNLLYDDFQKLPVLNPCISTSTDEPELPEEQILSVQPNPFRNTAKVSFYAQGEQIKISLFDVIGSELKVLTNQHFSEGNHELTLEAHGIPPGSYYVRLQSGRFQKTRRVIKQ